MCNINKIYKSLITTLVITLLTACPGGRPAPDTSTGTTTVSGTTFQIPNKVLNGVIPGCADAAELVNQSATLPSMPLTFDAQNIFDRVDTSAVGATYSFSLRPMNTFTCESTEGPTSPPTTVTFGFNYSSDFSRVDPLCLNASVVELTSFSVTGTLIDALIEPFFTEVLWLQLDRQIANGLHPLIIGGTRPATADPRCDNWVDQSTL